MNCSVLRSSTLGISQVIINKKQYWFSTEYLHKFGSILTSCYIWDNIYLNLRSLSFGGAHFGSIAHCLEGVWWLENIDLGGHRRQKQDAIIVGSATRGREPCVAASRLSLFSGAGLYSGTAAAVGRVERAKRNLSFPDIRELTDKSGLHFSSLWEAREGSWLPSVWQITSGARQRGGIFLGQNWSLAFKVLSMF